MDGGELELIVIIRGPPNAYRREIDIHHRESPLPDGTFDETIDGHCSMLRFARDRYYLQH